VTRDMCGRAMTYLAARTHYGACQASDLQALEPIWEQVLGLADIARLHDLYARLILVADGDTDAVEALAREYREIIGPPDPAHVAAVIRITRGDPSPGDPDNDGETHTGSDPASDEGQGDGDAAGEGGGQDPDSETETGRAAGAGHPEDDSQDTGGDADGSPSPAGGPTVGSLADALRDATEHAQAGQLEQFDEDVSLKDVLDHAANLPQGEHSPSGEGTGAPAGRMPDRGVDRPPMPDEVRAATVFARELERARTSSLKRIDKRTPGGHLNSRQYIRALAQRQDGRPITSFPWSIERRKRNPIRGPHVIFIVDTSGSMARYEYALGPIVWIADSGLRKVGGRMATGLFGDSAELLWDGKRPMRLVPAIRTGGGTAFAGDAIEMCADVLDMEDRSRPRLAYILSDGGWYDTKAGMAKIQELAALGVPTIHISLFVEPLSVLAARISVIQIGRAHV
jgi:hypothetical protein